ncbi:hypothetical protein LIER_24493 [Lithospermum erythrorhizon]|uniref:Uncharacterized protein n=1 Tax=Lithospermum erythrorhizon TaxID=34254 RepID=A0AAV3R4M1_LITER
MEIAKQIFPKREIVTTGNQTGGGTAPPRAGRPVGPPSVHLNPSKTRGGLEGIKKVRIKVGAKRCPVVAMIINGNSFRNDDTESEEEAPRRSRHGEGKKQT